MPKLLVLGLDGATWSIIEPLVNDGNLPNFKTLTDEGVRGNLESTIPPVTGPSWVSFATGLSPGKTGVFDFLVRERGSVNLTPISSRTIKGRAFWDILSSEQFRVGVFNFPMLYPPYETDGFMVSGAGSPDPSNITFPKKLKGELDNVTDGYELMVDYHNEKYDSETLFLEDLNRVLSKKSQALHYLATEKSWDMLLAVLSCTDWLQHLMWKHIDDSHPYHDHIESKTYLEEFVKVWERIDEILGRLLDALEDANVFIVSDHGFGPQQGCFYLNTWLEKEGFLARKHVAGANMRTGVRRVAKKILAPLISIPLLKRGMKKFDTQVTVADQVDFERSKAFALGHSIPFGAIYLNVEGREPHGFIEEKTRYREVKDEITRKLVAVDQEVDTRLEATIFDPKRIYEGNMLDLAPDILFTMNDWKCVIVKSFTDHVYEDKPYSNRHTGSHRMDGIFLAYGPDIKVGRKITNARIYDVAPTILHLFNRKIPATMDGKVLMSIFNENSSCAKRKPKYVAADPAVEDLRKKIRKLKRTKRI